MSPFQDGSMAEGWVWAGIPGHGLRLVSFLAYKCLRNNYAELARPWQRQKQVTMETPRKRGPKPKRAEER